MKRIYTNNGQGISTKITCTVNGKEYIISTVKDRRGFWQLAVLRVLFEIPYIYTRVDLTNSNIGINTYPGPISKTFEEAEKTHYKAEELISNHAPETWLYTMANWPSSDDQKSTGEIYTTTDYLDDLKQSESAQKETIQRMWARFQGKPNNSEDILKEKAKILARILLNKIRLHTEGFADRGNTGKDSNGDAKEKFISLGELFIEIASVYLSFIDKFAFSALSKQNRKTFIDTLQEELIASTLHENYRENADLMEDAFISDLNKRLGAYAPLLLYPDENKSEKGALLWEFANNVAKIVGREKDVLFNEIIMHTVLRDIDILQLEILLSKEK